VPFHRGDCAWHDVGDGSARPKVLEAGRDYATSHGADSFVGLPPQLLQGKGSRVVGVETLLSP
jgi:hypothetical protein